MFVGRTRELQSLEEVYAKKGFGMTIIYGRRRIGKSSLIREFVKGKKTIFYTATKVGAGRNLELFSRQVLSVLDPAYADARFTSHEALFDAITQKLQGEKLVLVIDELPYWAEKDEGLLSIMQKYIDTQWAKKNLMIILCGSALSFMENKILSEKSPLFGRRDSQIKLEAFNYREAALFVPCYSAEEKAICYGVTGGVAKYLALFNAEKSLDENIKNQFFSPNGYLFDETRNLLSQEFSDITLVNNIIEQIASGENTLNGIATKIREKEPTVLYSIEKLMEVGLVERRKCITEENNKKKTQYVLKDSMFKFWYRFIPTAYSVIEMGQGSLYYERVVKPALHAFMGSVFEDMARHYTLEMGVQGRFGAFITRAGTYWGTELIESAGGKKFWQTADIDVVSVSDTDKTAVVGECKFKNEPVDRSILETLRRRAALVSGKYKVEKYLLFSLSGFSDWFETAGLGDTVLISLADMYDQGQNRLGK
ncbi:MAG: ATP-binding protein [Treponema sp.]|nr:ATP-binding protein [Treponema sp.]